MTSIIKYKDLDLDFVINPLSGDVSKKIGVEAVKRSVRNLVMTNFFERPFRPELGSNIPGLLFEPLSPLTADSLEKAIEDLIINFEPRAVIEDIDARPDIDKNSYEITITFFVVNMPEQITLTLMLERLR